MTATRATIGTYFLAATLAGGLAVGGGGNAYGQTPNGMPPDHASHPGHQSASQSMPAGSHPANGPDLAAELTRLKGQVAQLQATIAKHNGPAMGTPTQMPRPQMAVAGGMPQMGMMGMGGMMGGGMPATGAMPGAGAMPPGGGMGMGCCPMMGQMAGSAGMSMSALPGFPGASHIYHIGETGFFLDHPEHITLSPEQATKLAKIRDDAMQARSDFERKIAAAEEQLGQLTSSDQPSFSSIEAKTREIEKLRGDQRLAFIRAVGEAAKVLTDEQRKSLLGQLPPAPNPATGIMQPMQQQPGGSMGGGMMMDDSMPMPPAGGGQPMGGSSGGPGMGDM